MRADHITPRLSAVLTVLCLVGVAAAILVPLLGSGDTSVLTRYPPDLVNGVLAYDVNDQAPTSYGLITETAVRLTNSDESSEVDFSLRVDNRRPVPMHVPALKQLRVINAEGAEATYLGGGWRDDQIVLPFWSMSSDFRFAAPPAGGMLLLEYREHADDTPVRIAVGYVLDHPDGSQLSN